MRSFSRAFSLLEMILVLVILAVSSAVVAVRLSSLRTEQTVAQAGRSLADQMARGRRLSISGGDLARLRLDLDAQTSTMQVRRAGVYADPSDAELAACDLRLSAAAQVISFTDDSADPKTLKTGPVDFVFSPDAHCNPSGRVTIQSGSATAVVVCPSATRPAYVEGVR